MLSSARGGRLCSKCRQDLLRVFERGFCGPTAPRARLIQQHSEKHASRPSYRSISSCAPLSQQASWSNRTEHAEAEQVDAVTHREVEDSAQDQLDAVRQLERALGQSLEDAIQEDESAAEDPVTAIRKTGAHPSQVAREARLVHGDSLPEGVLNEGELKVYGRLYGEPEPPIDAELEEEEQGDLDDENAMNAMEHELLSQSGDPVDYHDLEQARRLGRQQALRFHGFQPDEKGGAAVPDDHRVQIFDSAEDRIISIADSLDGEILDPSEEFNDDDNHNADDRAHPLTRIGKFRTFPSTVNLPKEAFIDPLQQLMKDHSNKHLKEVSERTFGGAGLPDSPLTPRTGRLRPQMAVPLDSGQFAMTEMEANAFVTAIMPPAYAAIMSVLFETRKRLGPTWLNELLANDGGPRVLDAGAGGAGILAWNEIVSAHWRSLHTSDQDPPPPPHSKSVVLTGSDTLRHRSASLLENTTFIPRLPDYSRTRESPTLEDERPAQQRKQFDVVIAPYALLALKEEWEKKQYVQNLWSLVSPSGGVLILIEKGIPRGFEVIAGARELLLERHISSPLSHDTHYSSTQDADVEPVYKKQTGMIIAPCTNHTTCPLYKIPGVSQGRKDFCSFQQRYIRPPQLQRVLGATDRNHDDVDFSYISVLKGRDLRNHEISSFKHLLDPLSAPANNATSSTTSPIPTKSWLQECATGFADARPSDSPRDADESESESASTLPPTYPPSHLLPRLLYSPLKRRGHIILDLCTPLGTLERWTVPRSFSRQAFRDARKAQWGDLWALGAKTRIPRSIKAGVSNKEIERVMKRMPGGGGGRGIGTGSGKSLKVRNRDERLKNQAAKLVQEMQEREEEEKDDQKDFERELADEFGLPVDEVEEVMQESRTDKSTTTATASQTRGRSRRTAHQSSHRSPPGADVNDIDSSAYDPQKEAHLQEWRLEFESDVPARRTETGAYIRDKASGGKASKAAKKMERERWRRAVRGEVGSEEDDEE